VLAHQDAALLQLAADGGRNGDRQTGRARGIREPSGLVPVYRPQQCLDPAWALAERGRLRDFV
jgi:hypothetical protein